MSNALVDSLKADDLESQITEALKPLSPKQRKFAQIFAGGDNSGSAAIKAGYAVGGADAAGSRLLRNHKYASVQHAIELLRHKYALEHGISALWKRKALVATYSHARDIDQPSAANQTLRTLMEMDGDIRTPANSVPSNIQININTGISREEDEKVIE
jgi:hypothetical protein